MLYEVITEAEPGEFRFQAPAELFGGFQIKDVIGDKIVLLNAALGDCGGEDGIATLRFRTYDITRSAAGSWYCCSCRWPACRVPPGSWRNSPYSMRRCSPAISVCC